jgi:hypothetical protein
MLERRCSSRTSGGCESKGKQLPLLLTLVVNSQLSDSALININVDAPALGYAYIPAAVKVTMLERCTTCYCHFSGRLLHSSPTCYLMRITIRKGQHSQMMFTKGVHAQYSNIRNSFQFFSHFAA